MQAFIKDPTKIEKTIGFLQHYGMSPSVDFLKDYKDLDDKDTINILIQKDCDFRHIIKTLSDNCMEKKITSKKFHVI